MTERPESFEEWRARTATPRPEWTVRDGFVTVAGFVGGAGIAYSIEGPDALAIAAGSLGFAVLFGGSRWWAMRRAARE